MSELKKVFDELALALKDLHRDLLMLEAKILEAKAGRKITPYELLHASLHSPELNWLRVMSAVIVHVDTIIDETTNLSGKEANQVANEVLTLLEKPPAQKETEFWNRYSQYLSANPDIIMKHSRVKTVLQRMKPSH